MGEKKLSFEKALTRLDEIVKKLESGEAQLDESLSLFEEGSGLVKHCEEMLNTAEQKVKLLKQDDSGVLAEISFEEKEQKV